jgi:hypothetical protein
MEMEMETIREMETEITHLEEVLADTDPQET